MLIVGHGVQASFDRNIGSKLILYYTFDIWNSDEILIKLFFDYLSIVGIYVCGAYYVMKIAGEFDGFVFGTPVYFASANGAMTSFMDRAFFTDLCSGKRAFYLKPAAAVVSARRAGTTATFDQMNKYFTLMEMPVVASNYWNMVHGFTPDDVKKDLEGLQVMRILGRNMAFFLKCKEAGLKAGVKISEIESHVQTNFIR